MKRFRSTEPPRRALGGGKIALWLTLAFLFSGCKTSALAQEFLPTDSQAYVVLPSLGKTFHILKTVERRLPGTVGLRKGLLGWMGLDASDEASLGRIGLSPSSDLVWALRPGSFTVAIGKADASKLVPILKKRLLATGLVLEKEAEGRCHFVDGQERASATLAESESGLVLVAWSLVPAARGPAPVPGLSAEAALDGALGAWQKKTEMQTAHLFIQVLNQHLF